MAAPDPAADVLIGELLARCTFPPCGAPAGGAVAAVSGGADSLALLVLARAAGLDVTAVHVDHGLRTGSAREAEVVAATAERFGARFRAETVVVEPGSDLEQRARNARRQVLGPDAMTGHTADDQAETVLLNLILALRRHETEALCRALALESVVDPTNTDPRFRRNRVRHELLPLMADIAERDPVPLLDRTAELARAVRRDIDELAITVDPTDTAALAALPPTVAHAALRRWLVDDLGHPPSQAEVARVMTVVRREAVACELSGRRRVARRHGVLRIEHR